MSQRLHVLATRPNNLQATRKKPRMPIAELFWFTYSPTVGSSGKL